MKTVIIPANSGATCVAQLKTALGIFKDESITYIFLQIRPMPDNYNDMFTLRRNMGKFQFFDSESSRMIIELKQQFGDQIEVQTDYIYGDSPAVFRNYVRHHNADLVIYDEKEWQDSKAKFGLNIFRMVSRCGCELMYVSKDNVVVSRKEPAAKNVVIDHAPDSVLHQYNAVNHQLTELEHMLYSNRVVSRKVNNLSRYFLNESILQKMLAESRCSLLLLKN